MIHYPVTYCPRCNHYCYIKELDTCNDCGGPSCLKPLYLSDPVLTEFANLTAFELLLFMIAQDRKARSQPKPMEVHLL